MTPISQVFTVQMNHLLDQKMLQRISKSGHSRVPVYDEKKIVGMLLVKRLISSRQNMQVKEYKNALVHIPVVRASMSCLDLLAMFQEGRSHMAVVETSKVEGIVTLEDVIEELIDDELVDGTKF